MGLTNHAPQTAQLSLSTKCPMLENHTGLFPSKTACSHTALRSNNNSNNNTFFSKTSVNSLYVCTALLVHLYLKCPLQRTRLRYFHTPQRWLAVEMHINLTRIQQSLLFLRLEYFVLGSFTTLKHNESSAANYLRGNKTFKLHTDVELH